jgi:hypothetical protein
MKIRGGVDRNPERCHNKESGIREKAWAERLKARLNASQEKNAQGRSPKRAGRKLVERTLFKGKKIEKKR